MNNNTKEVILEEEARAFCIFGPIAKSRHLRQPQDSDRVLFFFRTQCMFYKQCLISGLSRIMRISLKIQAMFRFPGKLV